MKTKHVFGSQCRGELEAANADARTELRPGVASPLFSKGHDLCDTRNDGRVGKMTFEVTQVLGDHDLFLPDDSVRLEAAATELKLAHWATSFGTHVGAEVREIIGELLALRAGHSYEECMLRITLALIALSTLHACGSRQAVQPIPPGEDAYPTVLTPVSELGGDFAMQQEVTMVHPEGENTFSAVLQKQGDTLTMMALGPHGGRAFMLVQRGTEVEYESFISIEFPFPPQYILHDIHRAWFARVAEANAEGERIEEERVDGRVMGRTFVRVGEEERGQIRVSYEGGLDEGAPVSARPPEHTTLENGWFGYTARIHTREWQAL